jgi:hypothetical protein
LSGATKSALSLVPGLGQAIAGWDAYKRSVFDRTVKKLIQLLSDKIENLEDFAHNEWFRTQEGEQFVRKVFDAAFDEQLQDKQELFVNALINGVKDQTISQLEKLKFVDMLRHLSRAALIVLAEMDSMFRGQVRGPGRQPDPIQPYPIVHPTDIAQKLADKYDPYIVTSAVYELESQGLFSDTGEWRKEWNGRYRPGAGNPTSLYYTDFAARFVEFITLSERRAIQ